MKIQVTPCSHNFPTSHLYRGVFERGSDTATPHDWSSQLHPQMSLTLEAGSSLYVLLLAGFLGFHLWLRQGTEEMVELFPVGTCYQGCKAGLVILDSHLISRSAACLLFQSSFFLFFSSLLTLSQFLLCWLDPAPKVNPGFAQITSFEVAPVDISLPSGI